MGGRKSYPTKSYLGNSIGVKKESKVLSNYLKIKEDPKIIAAQAIKLVASARKPIKSSIYSLKLFSEVYKDLASLKKISNENELRREISRKWDSVKKKNNYSKVGIESDRVIIESAVKTIRRKNGK